MVEREGPGLDELLERWKAAERRRDRMPPGSRERAAAETAVSDARAAYRGRLRELEPPMTRGPDDPPA
ncbi:MAG TPA: hypothetical protein VH720_12345 [Candidatus Limnocylindrales bacterium]